MSTDDEFAKQLRARVTAAVPAIPVDTSGVIPGARRRRAITRAGALTASLAIALSGWAGANALPSFSEAVSPTPERSQIPWAANGGTPCGTAFAPEETDAPDIEIRGGVFLGTFDRNAGFEWGQGGTPGDTLYFDVSAGPDVPDGPLDDVDRFEVTTVLVGPDGTVAFWTDPEAMIRDAATDGSGALAPDGLYDAVDCRTRAPLTGTYRAYAMTSTDGADGDETLELAPLSMELGSTTMAGQWPDRVPECGRPAPADLLSGDLKADFTVALDPGVDLNDVRKGLHVDVTVTATGTGRLTGTVPQALHALLVDQDGKVASQLYDYSRGEYDSAETFDVGKGESFSAELHQWFASCPGLDINANAPSVRAGTYDLYIYNVILASAGPDRSPGPRVAVGGPFPMRLR